MQETWSLVLQYLVWQMLNPSCIYRLLTLNDILRFDSVVATNVLVNISNNQIRQKFEV